uniref:Uncharacterized protein n=1 Tax=Kwoniella dejecticola CBS 10117 TaxID=1296121 RepID=A0A1A5ZUN7_9TREE|nr:uncharacterized protein I303_08291 [Kwoniella dejecticola CBS 10117]OBR81521.1 hypothetical protein I303_08291 [Kwoniella dejecticola CBS 10117]
MSESTLPTTSPAQGEGSGSTATGSTNNATSSSSTEVTQTNNEQIPNGSSTNAEAGPSSTSATAPAQTQDQNTSQNQSQDEDVNMENSDNNNPQPTNTLNVDGRTSTSQSNGNPPKGELHPPVEEREKGASGSGEGEGQEGRGAQSHPHGAEEEDTRPDLTELFAAKREEELARRDRSLVDFLSMLDGYKPLIPEEVTEYYLQRSGFECSDPRLKRLLSLSAQKFISDLSRDAYHFAKLRVNGTNAGGRGRPVAGVDRNRVVLTMDDLSLALGEHGVNVKKPDYYL